LTEARVEIKPRRLLVNQIGRILLLVGAALLVVGGLLMVGDKLGLGRLPGDFSFRSKNVSFHFPLATSLLISVLLTVLLNLWLSKR